MLVALISPIYIKFSNKTPYPRQEGVWILLIQPHIPCPDSFQRGYTEEANQQDG
jgi:hypothetical protein